jgi:hypothetical protein
LFYRAALENKQLWRSSGLPAVGLVATRYSCSIHQCICLVWLTNLFFKTIGAVLKVTLLLIKIKYNSPKRESTKYQPKSYNTQPTNRCQKGIARWDVRLRRWVSGVYNIQAALNRVASWSNLTVCCSLQDYWLRLQQKTQLETTHKWRYQNTRQQNQKIEKY